jgi:hypothetical protein
MRRARDLHEEMIRAHRRANHAIDHVEAVPPKSMIVDESQGLVHLTLSFGTWRIPGGCLELPTVESRFGWSRRDGVIYLQRQNEKSRPNVMKFG